MASKRTSDKALNPFPSTYKDRPRPSQRFRPAPDTDDGSVVDLTWFGEPLPAETLDFYNDEDENEDNGDGDETSGDERRLRADHARPALPPLDSALIYTAEGYIPDPYCGPVEVQPSSDGQGLCLVATEVIEESHLVLISGQPLAYASNSASSRSELADSLGKDIQDKIRSQDKWSSRLLDPSKPLLRIQVPQAAKVRDSHAPCLDQFLKQAHEADGHIKDEKQENAPRRRKYSSLFHKASAMDKRDIDYKRVALDNSYHGQYHDPASSCCRGEALTPFTALWPEVSLMEHSCWPNASLVVVGTGLESRAVVRATRAILHGEPITISHLPTLDILSPLLTRKETLRRELGLICTCDRCKAEESEADMISSALQSIHEAAISIRQQLISTLMDPKAIFEGEEESVGMSEQDIIIKACELVLDDAESLLRIYKEEMSQLNEGTMGGISSWLLAGAYPMYDMLAICTQHVDGFGSSAHVRALQGSIECLDVARGSETHTITSAMVVKMLGSLHGSLHSSTSNALRQCIAAHTLRYGSIAGASMAQLSSASMSCFPMLSESPRKIDKGVGEPKRGDDEKTLAGILEDTHIDDESGTTDSWGIPVKIV